MVHAHVCTVGACVHACYYIIRPPHAPVRAPDPRTPRWNDGQLDYWSGKNLAPHVTRGQLTAASLDNGRVIDRSDSTFQLAKGDHVYANWRNYDEWFYGKVTGNNCIQSNLLATHSCARPYVRPQPVVIF